MHRFITQQPTLFRCIPGRVDGDFYDDDDDDEDKDDDKDHNKDGDDMYDDILLHNNQQDCACYNDVTRLIALATMMAQRFCTTMTTTIMTMTTSFYYCGAGKIVLATKMLQG